MTGDLLIFGGSLGAITLVVILVWWMGLGGEPRIGDEAHARELAENAMCGFEPIEIVLDAKGHGALLLDNKGQILLLAPHGSHFASRLLDTNSTAWIEDGVLVIDSGEQTFARALLELGTEARAWDSRIKTLNG